MRNYNNEVHHPFLEALLDGSYSTVWSFINNNMALDGFNKAYECLGDKPILTYIIDDLAVMGGYKDREEHQKKYAKKCFEYYNSFKIDNNTIIDIARKSIIKNYKKIHNSVYKSEYEFLFDKKNEFNVNNVAEIFKSYDVSILNKMKIQYQNEEIDLASWLVFNIKDVELLNNTIKALKDVGFDFTKTVYDLKNIIISNDISSHDFYNKNLLIPKEKTSISSKNQYKSIYNVFSLLDTVESFSLKDKKLVLPYNIQKKYDNIIDENYNVPEKYTYVNSLLNAKAASDVDLAISLLSDEHVNYTDDKNKSLIGWLLSNKEYGQDKGNPLLKAQRLSAKNPDWFKGNESGFGLYFFANKKFFSGRDETYENKIWDNIIKQYTAKELLNYSIPAIEKMKNFHLDTLFDINIDCKKSLESIQKYSSIISNMIHFYNYSEDKDNISEEYEKFKKIENEYISILTTKIWINAVNHMLEILPHIKYDEKKEDNISFSEKIENENKENHRQNPRWNSYQKPEKKAMKNFKAANSNLISAFKIAPKEVIDNDDARIIVSAFKALPSNYKEEIPFADLPYIKLSSKISKKDIRNFNEQAIDIIKEFSNVLPPDNKKEFDNLMLKKNFADKKEITPKRKRRKTML